MRGNNSRKLINRAFLETLTKEYDKGHGVPLSKLIRNYSMDISAPHLRKLILLYIDILDESFDTVHRNSLSDAIFPEWLQPFSGVKLQPDNWTYDGKFPFGTWRKKEDAE